MSRVLFGLLFLAFALPAGSFAQGSGSVPHPTGPPSMDSNYPGDRPAYLVTRSVEGKIAEIKPDQHVIAIEDKNGKRLEFKLANDTKFRADKKTELAGRKNLSLGDFETGQPVRITYTASNKTATELRLRRIRQ